MVDRIEATEKFLTDKLKKHPKEAIIKALFSFNDYTTIDRMCHQLELQRLIEKNKAEEERMDKIIKETKEAIKEYTCSYGPICKYDVNVENYWDWVMRPWPWEGECGC